MTSFQHSMRQLLSQHPLVGYLIMVCVVFTIITLLQELFHLVGWFNTEHTILGRILLAAALGLMSLQSRKNAASHP